ncbi:hypothetical protein D3C74_460510 [compost metagenome]
MPPSWNWPKEISLVTAIAIISPVPAVIKLIGLPKSTFASIHKRAPTMPIMPYRTMPRPPMTPAGMVPTKAPNFGKKAKAMATMAATQ